MAEQAQGYKGWAKVEIMGHSFHVGMVTPEMWGASMVLKVDTPGLPEGPEITLDKGTWCGSAHYVFYPEGTVVKRAAVPAKVAYPAATSLYRLTPLTEEQVMAYVLAEARANMVVVRLPESQQLPESPKCCPGKDWNPPDDSDRPDSEDIAREFLNENSPEKIPELVVERVYEGRACQPCIDDSDEDLF